MKTMSNQLLKTVAFQTVVNSEMEKETQSAQDASENVAADVVSQNAEEASGDASVPAEESVEDGTTADVTDGAVEGEAAVDMTETETGAVDAQEGETAEVMDGSGDMMTEDGMGDMMGTETGTQSNGSVLASYPFVIGISAVTLALSIVIGILLGKRKIKKGLDLYED